MAYLDNTGLAYFWGKIKAWANSAFALLGLVVGGSFGWMTVLCGVGLGPVIDWMARMMKGIID